MLGCISGNVLAMVRKQLQNLTLLKKNKAYPKAIGLKCYYLRIYP